MCICVILPSSLKASLISLTLSRSRALFAIRRCLSRSSRSLFPVLDFFQKKRNSGKKFSKSSQENIPKKEFRKKSIPRKYSKRIFQKSISRKYFKKIFPENNPNKHSKKIFQEKFRKKYSKKNWNKSEK